MNCEFCGKPDSVVKVQAVTVCSISTHKIGQPESGRHEVKACEFCLYAALRMLGHAGDYFSYYGKRG